MTVSFDPTLLTSWLGSQAQLANPKSTTHATTSPTKIAAPKPPWNSTTTAPKLSTLTNSILGGQPLFNPALAKLSLTDPSSTTNDNYKNLFALYQGLNSLQQLATDASSTSLTSGQASDINKAFTSGIKQLNTYLQSNPFSGLSVVAGQSTGYETSTVSTATENDSYQTDAIYTGSLTAPVPSLAGTVAFSLSVKLASGATKTVNFNLADLGSTPRTLPNVINYLNGQLKAAGLTTRFADVRIPGTPKTYMANGKTYTVPAPEDSYALKIAGTSSEQLTFTPATSNPAVYVAQTSGSTASTSKVVGTKVVTTAATPTQQITALTADATAQTTSASQIYQNTLASQTKGAAYQATGPDGSLYTVSNVTGKSASGVPTNGTQNVVLTKYDSAGNVIYTRTIGSAGAATGYAVTVSADGKNVAVAGTVNGQLTPNETNVKSGQTDSFVAVFDTSTGTNQWTTRGGTTNGDDHPTGVAFGPNEVDGSAGEVYITGVTSARFNGYSLKGTQDGFIQGFSSKGVAATAQEFGSGGTTTPGGITVSGSTVYVASTENGDALLRTFNDTAKLSSSTTSAKGVVTNTYSHTLAAGATRDLGTLKGGNIAGVAIAADGSVVVAGSTSNTIVSGAAVQNAYTGGKETFVAKLASGATASAADKVTYYSAGASATTTTATLSNGVVYVAGQNPGAPDPASNGQPSAEGFVAGISLSTGQAVWTNKLTGADGQDLPSSIAVSATGSSALNALGLPTQTIQYVPSNTLINNSGLQAGDTFTVKVGNTAATTITIDANETYQTLKQKILVASENHLKVSIVPGSNGQSLSLTASKTSATPVFLGSGADGKDALSGLGLKPGELTHAATTYARVSDKSNLKTSPYALGLSGNLKLDSTADIANAKAQIEQAVSVVKALYSDLTTKPLPKTTGSSSSGKVPAYLTSQISDYKTALTRLQSYNSSSSSSASGTSILSLIG